jgi:hypothetical protein
MKILSPSVIIPHITSEPRDALPIP